MSPSKTVIIIGGHGQVSLHLSTHLSPTHTVYSIIRTPSHEQDVQKTGATPILLSLENDPKESFTKLFEEKKADVVVFSAGAGGTGGPERTKAVDYEGAVKIFNAIEGVDGDKPRLLLVSAVDIRDPEKIPSHYVSLSL